MDTNKLKKFAVDARNKIKAGVEAKLSTLGFDSKGNVPDSMKPQLMQGGSLWNGQLMTESFYHQWMALYDAVKQHGVHHIYEEAAYTWFNRLVAIRILQKNGIIGPVLTYADAARTPQIVDDARTLNRIPSMSESDRQRLNELLDDDTKVTEQFAILITAYCHNNPIIRQSFGRMADYTELLLPNNILAEGGFIDDLNHTEFITDEDYKSSQLIGWLYQFYISERKDEVFAKKGKYDADEIAPATQIFTPHWIVEYMVQNTIGRIYLDNHPEAEDTFKPKWKYLVEPSHTDSADDAEKVKSVREKLNDIVPGLGDSLPDYSDGIYHFEELTDLRFADLSVGSGHIVGYMFDLLFDLYIYEGYTRKEAVENILQYNLTGVDIDLRAKQLATFALLLKACQKDESFADGHIVPNVLTMPEPFKVAHPSLKLSDVCLKFIGGYEDAASEWLQGDVELMDDAQTLGSIMKFLDDDDYISMLRAYYDDWTKDGAQFCPDDIKALLPYVRIILALTQKYTALVMNPPYMGSGRFDKVLSEYVSTNYTEGKADLFSIFMLVAQQRIAPNGKYGMINMQSWMFLGSFEELRSELLETMQIESIIHLGPHTFDELSGEVVQNVSFVLSNHTPTTYGTYYNLTYGNNCSDKEKLFINNKNENQAEDLKIYFPLVNQKDFTKVPGNPIGYWISQKDVENFSKNEKLDSYSEPRSGVMTGNDVKFTRLFFECSSHEIAVNPKTYLDVTNGIYRWFLVTRGGGVRKWYGNFDLVDNLYKGGQDIINNKGNYRLRDPKYYFREGITWNMVSSNSPSFRYVPQGILFGNSAPVLFPNDDKDNPYILGFLNSSVSLNYLYLINPTINVTKTDIGSLPFIDTNDRKNIESLVYSCVSISKKDWDSHETSWDFAENPLVSIMKAAMGLESSNNDENTREEQADDSSSLRNDRHAIERRPSHHSMTTATQFNADRHASLQQPCSNITKPLYDDYNALVTTLQGLCNPAEGVYQHGSTLETAVKAFEKLWEARFKQLHANEEELNRQFIDIYGLQDELTPDVPFDEITILQQNEIAIKDDKIVWNNDTLTKQLISYAVGVCMGRYRLDKSGLHIAYPKPSSEDLAAYQYNGNTVVIDDDGIIPLLPHDSPFNDNMVNRLSDFIRIVFGDDYLAENLNFMEACLGETLEKYLEKDYWKDHKKMYQNRPIYWLFSSKKGAFKCIAYMHRMDAYTAERVRSKYLLPYIDSLQRKLEALDNRSAELSTAENRQRENIRKELEECREYHDRLQVVAEKAISFDLDDGVVVNYTKFGDVLAKIK